jgi:hypothetical protein
MINTHVPTKRTTTAALPYVVEPRPLEEVEDKKAERKRWFQWDEVVSIAGGLPYRFSLIYFMLQPGPEALRISRTQLPWFLVGLIRCELVCDLPLNLPVFLMKK